MDEDNGRSGHLELFDTHTHINADDFQGIEKVIIDQAHAMGVAYFAVVGFDRVTIERSLQLSKDFPEIISVLGCHPTEAIHYDSAFERDLEGWLALDRVRMLGEIGLDYHWDTSPVDIQKKVFRRQIAIAKEHDLPITIHNREATADCYQILKEEGLPAAGGIMHSFGGTREEAERFLDLGMHLSFSGVVTFKKSDAVREAAKITPLNRLLIETDAPYLAPVPMRGKRNEPAYVRYVAEHLANFLEINIEDLAQQTTQNAFDLFRWQPSGGHHGG